jgi:hypothetical protein
MMKYIQIDEIIENTSPEELASYIMANNEDYGYSLLEYLTFEDMERHYNESCSNQLVIESFKDV